MLTQHAHNIDSTAHMRDHGELTLTECVAILPCFLAPTSFSPFLSLMPLSAAARSAVEALGRAHPRFAGVTYSYGTSGFRGLGTTLDSVNLRMGVLAALRSWSCGPEAQASGGAAA